MINFLSIVWNVDPVLLKLGPFSIRYYSLLFVAGFPLGYYLFVRFFRREGIDTAILEPLLYILLGATIIGARLGHCLFYEPEYYLANPIEIIKVWHGGLASHGGAIALILAIWYYSAKYGKKHGFDMMWLFDRLVIAVCFAGTLIRLGNFVNSEIFGGPTTLPWGVKFPLSMEWKQLYGASVFPPDGVACHPTQLYEALSYLLLGFFLLWVYNKKGEKIYKGWIFGVFLIVLFGMRFLIEFIKNPQVDFEKNMTLDMGQWLSIPFILVGIIILVLSYIYKKPAIIVPKPAQEHISKENRIPKSKRR